MTAFGTSIERKVPLALGGLLLVLTVALCSTAYFFVRRAAERGAVEGVQAASRAVADLLAGGIPVALDRVRRVARVPALPAFLAAPGPAERAAALAALEARAAEPDVLAVELRDAAGTRRLAAGRGVAALAVASRELAAGLASSSERGVVGRLHAVADGVAVPLVVPLVARGERRVGYVVEWRKLVLGVRLAGARFLLANREGGPWTDGEAIVAPPPRLPPQAGVATYERPGSGAVMAGSIAIAGTPWLGVVEMPLRTVYRPARRFLTSMTALSAVLFTVSLALAWLWSRRITRPLGDLARAADAIARGDLSSRVAVARHDELGRLEAAFNHMAENLADSRGQLEERLAELRRAQEQFTRAQRMEVVGLLAGSVAHDFNNLLTVIMGEADLALADLEPDDPRRQPFVEIAAAGGRAAALTRQLLVFSRGQVIEPAVFDVNAVLEDSERMVRRLLKVSIRVVARPAPEPLPVRADRGQVEQVVMNLVVNARDAMPSGGGIYLETQRVTLDEASVGLQPALPRGEYAVLLVSDTGVGMSEEVKGRLFEPFFSTKQPGMGTGLGLTACQSIVRRWGGQIAVYSEEGVGTTVKVYFPVSSQAGAAEAPAVGSAGGSETVLVVDDEAPVRELASRILDARGYRVLAAPDAAAALSILTADAGVQLLLTDVVLPGTSGRELADRASEVRPGLRVLFMSGYTEDVILQRRLLAHDVVLLRKPFTAEKLARRVRAALDGRVA